MARMSNSCPVVLHVDLDCFYAAVEQVRLGIPVEQPLAVQQWEGLIAVNYAARAAGVVRHDRASEALRKCPDLHLVHVETIGNDGGQTAASRLNAKVSLERYRQASKQVLMIFHRFADISERASIDEAYLDVTKQVDQMVQKDYDWDYELQCLLGFQSSVYKQPDNKNKQSMIIEGDGTFSASDICDRRLLAGGMIADRLRSTVKGELGYTCSVGIATNKLLAKIASARHKPDTQTLIPPKAIPGLMQTLPLKKIKLLGGKVGEKLTEKWGCITAGEAQSVSLVALVSSFGNRLGEYVWKAVRGIQDEKVQEKQMPKSMLAAKSFQAINDFSSVRKWLRVLADELAIRMLDDVIQNHRQPHILQLYYRCGKKSSDQSKSCPMPPSILHSLSSLALVAQELPSERTNTIVVEESLREEHGQSLEAKTETVKTMQDVSIDNELKNADGPHEEKFSKNITVVSPEEEFRTDKAKMVAKLLQEASFRLFQRIDGSFPCTRLAIAATGYQDGPIQLQGSQSIQHFFGNLSERKTCIVEDLHPLSVKDLQVPKAKGLLKFLSPDPVNPEVKSSSWVSGRSGTQLQISEPGDDATEIEEHENIVADWHDKDLPAAEPEDIGIPFAVASSCQETIEVSNQVGHFSGSQLHKHLQNEVDLIDVNVEEQHHILKDIYKAKLLGESFHQRNHVKLQEGQVPKRRKVTSCKSGQQPISKFFPSNQ